MSPDRFDLVIIPEHDSLRGANVVPAKTALHRVTRPALDEAERTFRERLTHLRSPLIAVLVGGPTRNIEFSPKAMRRLADQLVVAVSRCSGSLAVTASRRTGAQNEMALREGLLGVSQFFWDGQGQNPYLGILALADAIVVTSDSVSMVSEACATGKPVHVFSLGGEPKKLRQFHSALMDCGITRPFFGLIEQWSYEPLNETERVAAIVRECLDQGYSSELGLNA